MNDSPYIPHPIDLSDIELPDGLKQLVELLARNVHETWAQNRLNEGLTYGPELNDTFKHHPCLVIYDELSEIEKDYDRNTAVATLKTIIKLGWTIEK